ncbi:hypothetical protein EGR_11237 [Echinococcus granulosus]|uniref:Uncharacterized protein n=1 Tax=Echinococcus granulosus TaxID=6210 RepID=W6U0C5_ECHGR|nr:hypothetical protein EGR_11237 [Echinococcus granulosus]EUB53906.1 hypothetical protein EGR_11237 [Echinococcus granulosus]
MAWIAIMVQSGEEMEQLLLLMLHQHSDINSGGGCYRPLNAATCSMSNHLAQRIKHPLQPYRYRLCPPTPRNTTCHLRALPAKPPGALALTDESGGGSDIMVPLFTGNMAAQCTSSFQSHTD